MSSITQHIIIEGHFSRNGNFIGTNTEEQEIHIYRAQMEFLKLKNIDDIKFPLFAVGTIKTFDRLTGELGDSERKKILKSDGENETFERLTALAVFQNFEDIVDAHLVNAELNLDEKEIVAEEYRKTEDIFKKYFEYKTEKLRQSYES